MIRSRANVVISRFATIVVAGLFTALPLQARGESEPAVQNPSIPDVEKIIFDCNEAERANYRSGVTTRMRAAALGAAMCIRNAIVENMVILAGEEKRQETLQQLDQLNSGIGGFYWRLYNNIEPCFRGGQAGCGTMYHSFHNARVEHLYAEILRDTIRARLKHHW